MKFSRILKTSLVIAAAIGVAPGLLPGETLTPSRSVEIHHTFRRGLSPDHWMNGFLPMFESIRSPGTPVEVWMYDHNGRLVIRRTRILPEGVYQIVPWDVAARPDGTLVLSADLWSSAAEAAAVLCFVKPPGILEKIVRTEVAPDSLGVAADGKLWGFGAPTVLRWKHGASYNTLVNWNASGLELGSSLQRGNFATHDNPALYGRGGVNRVLVSKNRFAVYSTRSREWIELAPSSGTVMSRFSLEPPQKEAGDGPAKAIEVVVTESGRVYAHFATGHLAKQIFFQLDGKRRRWIPLPADQFPPDFRGLRGTEGDDLILRSGPGLYGWFPAPDVVGGTAATKILPVRLSQR